VTHAEQAGVRFFPEPLLVFNHEQALEDPRDGLTLFGPLDAGKPFGIRAGVIGTEIGVQCFQMWAESIQMYTADKATGIARPPFPGFQAVFRIPWNSIPALRIIVPHAELNAAIRIDDRHQRIHQAVSVFADRILEASKNEDTEVDLWFVVIPDVVHEYGRPQSSVPPQIRIPAPAKLGPRLGRRLKTSLSLFPEENRAAVAYTFEPHFHNQLKARLLPKEILTQLIRESTIWPTSGIVTVEPPKRDVSKMRGAIAWNISTAAFYKAGGRPWKMQGIRKGVCYLGLVYKNDITGDDPRSACCAAQMFLDSGDGVVFKGALGPWYVAKTGEFHLTHDAARDLVTLAVDSYKKQEKDGKAPAELFIHGKTSFSDEEWRGCQDAVDPAQTNLVGVKIRGDSDLRLFRTGSYPVVRGTAYVRHGKSAYLWTRGFAPRLRTVVGLGIPRPLRIDVERGAADVDIVLADILSLTKLNYNTCLLADGLPVTLRFADKVGEILTAAPNTGDNPLPFKHYI
jgi:hypothetical protein